MSKYYLITIVLVALISSAMTKYYWPNVVSKTEIKEVEVQKNNIVTVVKEVVKKDGTKEVVTTTTDKSTTKTSTKASDVKKDTKSDLLLTGGIVTNFKDKPEYMLGISKRITGPIFVGATYQTNNTYGLNITIEF